MMVRAMRNPLSVVAAAGLALGAILGMAGTMAAASNLRAAFWAIDSVGVVVATAILAISYFRKGKDAVAAGFLVYAIGEAVVLSGTAATLEASIPAFAAGTALWSAALLLTSVPKEFDNWTRATGILGALLFAVTSAKIFWGEQLTPIARPLPFYAYPFLVFTFAGWTWTLLRER